MVYTKDLKSFGLTAVRVQVPPEVQLKHKRQRSALLFLFRKHCELARKMLEEQKNADPQGQRFCIFRTPRCGLSAVNCRPKYS